MYEKYLQYHHALLHINADLKTEVTEMVIKDMTFAAPSNQSEEVLIMTYQVEVTAADGSATLGRALLGPFSLRNASLKSYVYHGIPATLK